MASDWRFVMRHVRFWRGEIQRWSTVYRFQGTPFSALTAADALTVANNDKKMIYGAVGSSGLWQAEIYDVAAGGSPVVSTTYFDPETPASWTGYPTNVYTSQTPVPEPVAEVALLVVWPAGLSRTGKTVELKKWYHGVPQSSALAGAVDVSPANVTALQAQAVVLQGCLGTRGLGLGTPGRTSLGAPVVRPFYANHQMPRGRRRKALVTASGRYTGPSIIVPDQAPALN